MKKRTTGAVAPTVVVPTTMNWEVSRGGGLESFLRDLAAEAQKRSVPLVLLSTGNRELHLGSVTVRPIVEHAVSEFAFVRALRRRVRSDGFLVPSDGVILANAEHYVWPFLSTKQPVLLLAHGAVPPTLARVKGRLKAFVFEQGIERRAVARASLIAAVSQETVRYYAERFPSSRAKIIRLPMGIDFSRIPRIPERFSTRSPHDSARPKVLFVGRLSREKGLPLLLSASRRLQTRAPGLQLIIVGEGPLAAWLQRAASRNPHIHLLGSLPRVRVLELMQECDLLAITSGYEGLPTVLLEALALGLPVVTTNVGVASEVVRPEIGVIAKAEPVAFAEGMEAALRIDRTVARQFAASARPDMSFTRTSDCLFELLAKAAENRP